MGLRGESQVSNDFPKIVDKIPDDLGGIVANPGLVEMLESFGFWGRKFCIKNVEILSVGKIAEFAKFAGGKRRKSPDRFSLIRATASYRRSSSWKLTLTRGRVPLSVIRVGINVSRFATRAWACGERVRYPTIFPKSLIRYLMNEG